MTEHDEGTLRDATRCQICHRHPKATRITAGTDVAWSVRCPAGCCSVVETATFGPTLDVARECWEIYNKLPPRCVECGVRPDCVQLITGQWYIACCHVVVTDKTKERAEQVWRDWTVRRAASRRAARLR